MGFSTFLIVPMDDHVCFSVRNMPKRTTATSQNDQFQNIPENSSFVNVAKTEVDVVK